MATESSGWFLAAQQYPAWQRMQKAGRAWPAALSDALAEVAEAGLAGWEPSFQDVSEVQPLVALLGIHGLRMRSFYVGGELHSEQAPETIARMLDIARAAAQAGAEIAVVNPNPIRWGSAENKSDAQLRTQAQALDTLGRELGSLGVTLAYHTHDAEMRASAREFHHMLLATDPANVSLCLDAHWIYRGAENSLVALYDITRLYAARVTLLHLRQSQANIWSEMFEVGDLDYAVIAAAIAGNTRRPILVLEQALEAGTPETMPPVEAYRRGQAYAQAVFACNT